MAAECTDGLAVLFNALHERGADKDVVISISEIIQGII